MNDRYLYRGINQEMYEKANGELRPKLINQPFSYVFKADGSIKANGSATAGPSKQNAVLGHQLNSSKFPTSGISTTPFLERAQYYATGKSKKTTGYVFKLDRKRFREYGIEEYIVSEWVENPNTPENAEVILVSQALRELPRQIIAMVTKVNAQPKVAADSA